MEFSTPNFGIMFMMPYLKSSALIGDLKFQPLTEKNSGKIMEENHPRKS